MESSPFVERLISKGFEVLYLTEPVDEYCIQAMPEFEGKKFQNVAKVRIFQSTRKKEPFFFLLIWFFIEKLTIFEKFLSILRNILYSSKVANQM